MQHFEALNKAYNIEDFGGASRNEFSQAFVETGDQELSTEEKKIQLPQSQMKSPSPYSRLSESTRLSCELGGFSDEESQQLVPMESIKNVKRGNSLSHCQCFKTEYKDGVYLCIHASQWLKLVE